MHSRNQADLLSAVAIDNGNAQAPELAFKKGMAVLNLDGIEFKATSELSDLSRALKTLEGLAPLQKPVLLKSIAAVMEADEKITHSEQELFRAIADTLDCPIPPLNFIDTQ